MLGYRVRAGGPAVDLMPDYLSDVAEVGGEVDALARHNPKATFTSRGCTRKCEFCAVPVIEGDLRELRDGEWEPKPVVCDNNLLACSRTHFDEVVDSLKGMKGVDFNQGLDARLLTKYHADRLAELDCPLVRLAWDHIGLESRVMAAIELLTAAGFSKSRIKVYVLLGYDDTPEDALYRLQTLKDHDVFPNPQRYQPLDALEKNTYLNSDWSEWEMRRFMKYWSRLIWYWKIPFGEFRHLRSWV